MVVVVVVVLGLGGREFAVAVVACVDVVAGVFKA